MGNWRGGSCSVKITPWESAGGGENYPSGRKNSPLQNSNYKKLPIQQEEFPPAKLKLITCGWALFFFLTASMFISKERWYAYATLSPKLESSPPPPSPVTCIKLFYINFLRSFFLPHLVVGVLACRVAFLVFFNLFVNCSTCVCLFTNSKLWQTQTLPRKKEFRRAGLNK